MPKDQADRARTATALTLFELDTGRYPTTIEGLDALVEDPGVSGWQGPYIEGSRDDLLSRYHYRFHGDGRYSLEPLYSDPK